MNLEAILNRQKALQEQLRAANDTPVRSTRSPSEILKDISVSPAQRELLLQVKAEFRKIQNKMLPEEPDRMKLEPELSSLVRLMEQHQKELSSLETYEFDQNPELIRARLFEDLSAAFMQLRELKSFTQSDLSTLRTQLDQSRALRADRESLQTQLNTDLLDQEAQFRSQAKSNIPAQQAEKAILETKNKQLLKALARFVDSYYPRPSPDDAAQIQKKKRVAPDKEPAGPYHPLKTILSDLMNQAVTQAEDPWVVLGPLHWGPYIELLVRADIAILDPEGTHIRLASMSLRPQLNS